MRALTRRAAITASLAAGLVSANAETNRDLLRIVWRDPPTKIDFYADNLRSGFVLSLHLNDGLVYRDPETLQIKPLLATAWKQTDDTTIEFTLRDGVTFHDGTAFTAADVAATVARVVAGNGLAVPSNYSFLAGAEAVDPGTVRLKLRRAFPAALDYLAMVLPILSRGVPGPGTGPYRLGRFDPPNQILLERNDDYFGGSPKGRAAIQHLAFAEALDDTAQLAAMTSGQADWTWDFPASQFDVIARDPTLRAVRSESMRVTYLSMDAAGRTGEGMALTNEGVRRAIVSAIDRPGIAANVVGSGSRPLDTPCFPSQFGCEPGVAIRGPFDPARARALLTEAGFPNGFSTVLVSDQLPAMVEAVRAGLANVGIAAEVRASRTAAAIGEASAGRAPLFLSSWGSYGINDVSAFMPPFFGGGPLDYTRDADLIRIIDEAGSTADPDRRRKLYADAIRRITGHADWLPIASAVRTYAFARALSFRPTPDDLPRFYLASWS